MRSWFASHHYSTWMIVASLLLMAALVHPSLASYLLVTVNVGLMIITREVARLEGSSGVCWQCLIGAGAIIVIAFVVMMKINWLAI